MKAVMALILSLSLTACNSQVTTSSQSKKTHPGSTPQNPNGPKEPEMENTFGLPDSMFQVLLEDFRKEIPINRDHDGCREDLADFYNCIRGVQDIYRGHPYAKLAHYLGYRSYLQKVSKMIPKISDLDDEQKKQTMADIRLAEKQINARISSLKAEKLEFLSQFFKAPYHCTYSHSKITCPPFSSFQDAQRRWGWKIHEAENKKMTLLSNSTYTLGKKSHVAEEELTKTLAGMAEKWLCAHKKVLIALGSPRGQAACNSYLQEEARYEGAFFVIENIETFQKIKPFFDDYTTNKLDIPGYLFFSVGIFQSLDKYDVRINFDLDGISGGALFSKANAATAAAEILRFEKDFEAQRLPEVYVKKTSEISELRRAFQSKTGIQINLGVEPPLKYSFKIQDQIIFVLSYLKNQPPFLCRTFSQVSLGWSQDSKSDLKIDFSHNHRYSGLEHPTIRILKPDEVASSAEGLDLLGRLLKFYKTENCEDVGLNAKNEFILKPKQPKPEFSGLTLKVAKGKNGASGIKIETRPNTVTTLNISTDWNSLSANFKKYYYILSSTGVVSAPQPPAGCQVQVFGQFSAQTELKSASSIQIMTTGQTCTGWIERAKKEQIVVIYTNVRDGMNNTVPNLPVVISH